MRIAHIIWSLNLGGIETMLVNIVNEQAKFADITLFIINDDVNADLLHKISREIEVVQLHRHSKGVTQLIRLNYLLWKRRYDIVHVQSKEIGLVIPFWLIKSKFVYTIHDVNVARKYIARPYNLRISISKSVEQDVLERLGIQTVTIPNGIKVSEFKTKNSVWKGNNKQRLEIVQLSRLVLPKKGQHILIKAISILKSRKINNIHCTFIGLGNPEKLKNLAKELNVEKQLTFAGGKTQSYIRENLCSFDLLVQPSIFEGFGLTVAEGMAAKVPVLVSDIEGPMEIIGNGKYGLCFKVADAVDCADKIEYFMNSDSSNVVEAAYSHVLKNYNVEMTAKKYIEAYKTIL